MRSSPAMQPRKPWHVRMPKSDVMEICRPLAVPSPMLEEHAQQQSWAGWGPRGLRLIEAARAQVMAVARTLVAHEDAVLEAEASNPAQQKARELGVDPLWAPNRKAATAAAFAAAPRFLLLDFRCGICRLA